MQRPSSMMIVILIIHLDLFIPLHVHAIGVKCSHSTSSLGRPLLSETPACQSKGMLQLGGKVSANKALFFFLIYFV